MPAEAKTRAAELTTTEGAVLALLAIEGERSGYDLLKLAERAVGHVWSPAKSGLYAVLPRLVADGLAARRKQSQRTRPDKHLYRITTAGRAALDCVADPGRARRAGDVLREALRRRVDDDRGVARARRAVHGGRRRAARALRAIEPTNTNRGHDWFHRHMLRYGIEQAEHDLAWADGVARALARGPR